MYQAFKNEEGETDGILVFAYDVTQQVLANRQLQFAYEELEAKVNFRNLELEKLKIENEARIRELETSLQRNKKLRLFNYIMV